MNKKNTLTRWILTQNKLGELNIEHREVSRFAPLNRILDEVGFYALEFFEINSDKYFCTYKQSEKDLNKSMIHLGKRDNGQLFDMSSEDLVNLDKIKEMFFTGKKNILH